jgi:hypothetical protein
VETQKAERLIKEQWRDEEKKSNINLSGIERYSVFKLISTYLQSLDRCWMQYQIKCIVI